MENNVINFYGRKKGRMTERAEALYSSLLPQYRVDINSFTSDYFSSVIEAYEGIRFEIGFGSGDFIFDQASKNPHILYIGVEVFQNGVVNLLDKLQNSPLENLKIYHDNAYNLFSILPENVIDVLYILFPDPWMKARHNKRRLIQPSNLDIFSKIIKPNGIFRFVSDHYEYVSWTLQHLLSHKNYTWAIEDVNDFLLPPSDHSQTKYEAKALKKGLEITYLTFKNIK